MGKTGGHKKKSSKTGTQKKTLKLTAREHRKAKTTREAARKEMEELMSPEAQKFLTQFQTGEGQKQAILNAQDLLKPILENQRKEAMQEFEQSLLPQIGAQYGGGGRSSAYNQALAAARTNLSNQLFGKSQELALNYGSNLAANQQAAAQQVYQNRMNAAQQASRAGLEQAQLGATTDQSVYIPKGTPLAAQLLVAGAEGAGRGAAAAATGGASEVAKVGENVNKL